jgi:hypothetical protein
MKKTVINIAICLVTLLASNDAMSQNDFNIHNLNLEHHDAVIYPNPLIGTNVLKIKSSITIKDIKITNVLGNCIQHEENKHQIYNDITIKLNSSVPGVYYAKITFEDDKCVIKKLLIK